MKYSEIIINNHAFSLDAINTNDKGVMINAILKDSINIKENMLIVYII